MFKSRREIDRNQRLTQVLDDLGVDLDGVMDVRHRAMQQERRGVYEKATDVEYLGGKMTVTLDFDYRPKYEHVKKFDVVKPGCITETFNTYVEALDHVKNSNKSYAEIKEVWYKEKK